MQLRSGFHTGEQEGGGGGGGGGGGSQSNNAITLSTYIITNMAPNDQDDSSTKAQAGTSSHGSDYGVDQEEGHGNNGRIGSSTGALHAPMHNYMPSPGNPCALVTSVTDWATASATDNNSPFRGSGAQFTSGTSQQTWADGHAPWSAVAQTAASNMRKRRMHDENPDYDLQDYTRDPNSPDRMEEDLEMIDFDAAGEGQGSKPRTERDPKKRKRVSDPKGRNGHHEQKDQVKNGGNGHADDKDVVMG